MKKKSTFSIPANYEGVIMLPLGGCGQIGKNMTLYCYKGTWIMIDIGASFGDERIVPGIDIIVPDINFIRINKIKISAIILTHVHEDHVGAVSQYVSELKAPIYGTDFAIEFTKLRLKDRGVNVESVKFVTIQDKQMKIGNFTIDPVFLTHSIPEMNAMFIKAGEIKLFHTGDWKIDPNPVVGEVCDLEKATNLAKDGVTAIMCDSTNVLSEGHSQSEGDLFDSLYEVLKNKKGRILVTSFASNVARIHTIASIAEKLGRKIGLSGLSLHKITAISQKLGYLKEFDFLDAKEAMQLDREECLIICTGCQGEPLATTAKVSNNSHPIVKVVSGDTVVFSSKIIPGNEKKIGYTLNRFADKDIEVITEREHFVHVSGHPKKDEIRKIYNLMKPKFAIPIHGDSVNLREHCAFVGREKLAEKSQFIKDGDVILISKDKLEKVGNIGCDYLCFDGNELIKPSSNVLSERRKVKDEGSLVISFSLELKAKKLKVKIIPVAVILDTKENLNKIYDCEKKLEKMILKDIISQKKLNTEKLEKQIFDLSYQITSRFVKKNFDKSPLIKQVLHIV